MKNILIVTFVLVSTLLMSCGQTPQEKAALELDSLQSRARYEMYRQPPFNVSDTFASALLQAGKTMDVIAKTGEGTSTPTPTPTPTEETTLIDLKKISKKYLDSNTKHTYLGCYECGYGAWLIHDPDCPKCAANFREEMRILILRYSR